MQRIMNNNMNNKSNNCFETIYNWLYAFAEMLFASVTLSAFTDHVITIFWGIVTTIVIFITNKLLKKYFP